jgi:ATP-dependent helicase/nuclease subunit B
MIRVLESNSSEIRLQAARDFAQKFPPATELILVGPSRDAIDDFARASAPQASFGWHRFTLPQLAKRLAAPELAARGLARATVLGVEAVAARVAFELHREGRLPYFAPVADSPGFARSLASTLLELRMARVAPADLVSDIMKLPLPALTDLSWLLERFEKQCQESGIADWATVLEVAEQIAIEQPARDPVLLLDLPIRTPAERAFLETYLAAAPEVLITIPAGDEATRDAVKGLGKTKHIADPPAGDSSLDRLRQYLFAPETPPEALPDDRVTLFSAPGEGRECVEIARRILEEARKGVPFDRMAVFTRSPETYAPVLETALHRAGVPAYFVRGARRPDPAGRAFLAVLGCAVEKLSARAFAEYLSMAQVPNLGKDGAPPSIAPKWMAPEDEAMPEMNPVAPPADDEEGPAPGGSLRAPWNWEKLLVEASVIGGKYRWQRRLDGLEFEITLNIRESRESTRREYLERQRENLRHLRRFALPVITKLAALPESAPWGAWLDGLSELAPMVLHASDRVLELLAELRPMSDMGPVTLAEVREVLRTRLGTLPQDPPESRYGRVLVAPLAQSRGRVFDVVFVPGLAERMFPQKLREDPLLLDEPRVALGHTAALPFLTQRAGEERLLLRLAAGAARERLYLSYPRMELASSRSRVPSFYGLDVMRAITGVVPDFKNLERDATDVSQARLAWPAPPRAELAIDDMEYDLAALGPALKSPRFLLALNPALGRSLRARYARWERKAWSSHDGLILSQQSPPESPARAALEKYGLRARPYSASALQKFAVCPYQFFLGAILHLEPRPDTVAIEELDPQTRGRLVHQVLARLMRSLRDAKLLPVSHHNLAHAEREMDEVLNLTAAQMEEQLAPAIPGVWMTGVEGVRADLRGWLRNLAEHPEPWIPAYFEYSFGLKPDPERDSDSHSENAELAGGYLLRGAVDLIEGLYDTGTGAATALRITDYKSGVNRTKDGLMFGGGELLQPALYALAVESIFPSLKVRESRLSFCTAAGEFKDRVVTIDDHLRTRSAEVLAAIDDAIAFGFLPPAPRENACTYCDFISVCGPYEETRWKKKDHTPQRLEDLRWIRGLP